MKIVKIAVLIILLLVGAVVLFAVAAFASLDRAAKIGIEQGGSYAMGVDTTLDKADVAVFAGTFTMAGLRIANPQGFRTPHFLALADGGVSINYESLTSDTITVPTLTLTGIDLYLDKEEGSSNYQRILDNLKRFESGDSPEPKPTGEAAKALVIQELAIRDITVHADVIGTTPTKVQIDEILLTNVGSAGGDTLELAGVFAVVVKAVMLGAIQAGAGALPEALLGELQSGLGSLESLGDLGIGVAAQIGGVTEDLGGLADDIGKGVFKSADEIGKSLEDVGKNVGGALDEAGKGIEDAGKGLEEAAKGLGGLLGGKKKTEEEKPKD